MTASPSRPRVMGRPIPPSQAVPTAGYNGPAPRHQSPPKPNSTPVAPRPPERKCTYCGGRYAGGQCPGCGARS